MYLAQGKALPSFKTLNHLNQTVSNEILKNRWSILFLDLPTVLTYAQTL